MYLGQIYVNLVEQINPPLSFYIHVSNNYSISAVILYAKCFGFTIYVTLYNMSKHKETNWLHLLYLRVYIGNTIVTVVIVHINISLGRLSLSTVGSQ